MNQINDLPLLLRRKHLVGEFGFTNSLYYTLMQKDELPTITLNGRKYIHRDKFLEFINATPDSTKGGVKHEEGKIRPV